MSPGPIRDDCCAQDLARPPFVQIRVTAFRLQGQAIARLVAVTAALAALVTNPAPVLAQGRTDVIRGRVIGPDTMPIVNATVTAVDTVAKIPKPTRTDVKGAFSIPFENGSGVYLVAVQSLGHAPQRRTVTRAADGSIPVLEFKMVQVAAQLGAVRSVGERPKTYRTDVNGDQSVGGQTTYMGLSNGLTGDLTGDLTSALSTIPGVTIIPSATGGLPTVSAFGIDGGQNGLILNGMGFGGSVPRDGFSMAVVTSTYDPSKGGFAGIQQSLRMTSGSNFISRTLHTTFDEPSMQYTTPVASQLAGRYGQQIVSGTLSGPVVLDHVFYSTAFQVQRRASGLSSLASADPTSLAALRISPDSVNRLLSALGPAGIPLSTSGVPDARENMESRLSARIDWIPHPAPPPPPGLILFGTNSTTQDAYYVEFGGTARTNDGSMIGATSIPSFGGQQTHRDGWAQFTAAKYLWKSILNETTLSGSASADRTSPYLDLPAARILVTSTLPSGELGLSTLQVGGNSSPRNETRGWSGELRNQTSWNTWDRRHSFALTLSAATDGYSIDQDAGYGTFAFSSLADFENGIPASYSRTLTGRTSSGHGVSGAIGVGDTYTPKLPSPTLGQTGPVIQYGVRIEANHLGVEPAYNPQIESAFGLRTDHVPSTAAIMPMLGFRWPVFGQYKSPSGFLGGARGTLSGGIREYRGTFTSRAIDPYTRQTGLPDAIQQLFCVGEASPAPNWRGFEQSAGRVPTACANGSAGTVLSQTTPPVALLSPDYQLFESWRPVLSLDYRVNDWVRTTLNGTYATNRNVPGQYDVNFSGVSHFALSAEGGRPVFVSPSSVVATTGTSAWTESRVSPLFAHVAELRTDLRSENRSLGGSISYSPLVFGPSSLFINATLQYAYSDSREEYAGFGSSGGDPRVVGWSRGIQARHAVTLTMNVTKQRWGSASLFGRLQSGQAYTPSVIGDINGDGYNNDRAFVFNPASTLDTSVANAMSSLLAGAPPGARDCLRRQLGTVAGRASCVGPWSFNNLSLQLQPDAYRLGFKNRGTISLFVNNILSGVDQALHGSSRLHGWGQTAIPDASLLTVHGFDPGAQQFKYTVNPQFGSTAVFRNTFRSPLTLTLDVRFDISPDRESQFLQSLLTPRRADGVSEFSEQQIKARIARGFNPFDQILLVRDSLKLTDAQVDSMRKIGLGYMATRDSVGTAIAKYLVSRHGDYASEEVRQRWHQAGITTYRAFLKGYTTLFAMLTPEQMERSKVVPQTAGIVTQINQIKESDLPFMFRSPLPSLP